jgi:DNA-binding transcriptional LysR family regulator
MEHLSDIAVFVRVVEAGSFTAAADKLGLSQSAVSKSVNRLEEHMGTRLLNRSTRKLSLTEAGAALHERGKRALGEIEEAELEVARLQTEPRGVLRVNAPMSFGILHISPLMPEFLERYPALTVDLQLDDRLTDLVDEGFDCAIRIKALDDSTLVAKKLGPCRQVICASPQYLKRHGTPRTPQELKEHNVLVYTYRTNPGEWELRGPDGKKTRFESTARLHSNNGIALVQAALKGLGILVPPTFYVGKELKEKKFVTIMDDYTVLPELNIHAVYPERRHLSPKVRAFVDFLAERIGPEPYWDKR